jgi:hypothetical protein
MNRVQGILGQINDIEIILHSASRASLTSFAYSKIPYQNPIINLKSMWKYIAEIS